jgi:predicted ATP-dependent protease
LQLDHPLAFSASIAFEQSYGGIDGDSASGVAALTEHGARIASRKGKITARFGRIADIVREASFLAVKAGASLVSRAQVEEAVVRTKYRASLPSTRFQELIHDGTIMVQTQGGVVGQINGLAVINAGQLSYGFPARITATIGAGQAGVINIEGAATLSGAIHTKGFHILGGLLRHLLQLDHPLAFSASIAFEQSYGGIDGDSASGVSDLGAHRNAHSPGNRHDRCY